MGAWQLRKFVLGYLGCVLKKIQLLQQENLGSVIIYQSENSKDILRGKKGLVNYNGVKLSEVS